MPLVTTWTCHACPATGTDDRSAAKHTEATSHATTTHNVPEKP